MTGPYDPEAGMLGLRRALPYLRLYRGRTFVVKVGGALCGEADAMRDIAEQVGVLRELGIRVVVVHGGGPQTTDLAKRLGVETSFVEGRRVTSDEALDAAVMTMNGAINTAFLSAFRAADVPAAGVSGVDAAMIRVKKRPPRSMDVDGVSTLVDYGRVGDVVSVDPALLNSLLQADIVPVVSPLCADDAGQVLNVNADTVAAVLAIRLNAEKLFFLTDTAGLLERLDDPRTLVSYVDLAGLDALQARGCIGGGMMPKIAASRDALVRGVGRIHMVGWKVRSGLLREVFTNEGAGTLIVRDASELRPAEHAEPEGTTTP
jgi:acetylglutamate kinase